MIRAAAALRLARIGLAALPALAAGLALLQAPFADPWVDRGLAATRLAAERAVAATVDADWLVPRLEEAVATGDRDRVALLAGLAADHGIALPRPLDTAAAEAIAAPGLAAQALDCARCAVDAGDCATLSMLAACALPVEMTVLGDLNALRRQAGRALAGTPVDGTETALALAGIAATAAAPASAGSSLAVKSGASALRVARRVGTLSPGMRVALRQADAATLARAAASATVLRARTSTAEALVLLRHADTPADLARLARLSEAAGPQTRATVEVLGKARALRLTLRLSDLALGALALLWAACVQLAIMAASALGRAALPRTVAMRPAPAA